MRDDRDAREARVWRILRRLLPSSWRARNGDDVLQVHVALAGGPARARGVRFWLRVARDVVVTSFQVRADGLAERHVQTGRAGRADALSQTLRMGLRALRRAPGFALSVVAIFALGMGANVTMFRVLDRVLLSPPAHIREAGEVRRVHVFGRSVFTGQVGHNAALAYSDYRHLGEVTAAGSLAGYTRRELTLAERERTGRVRVEFATASYFPLLGVTPAAGRFYHEDEDRLGAGAGTAVLSHALWQRRFGGSAAAIGAELTIGRGRYTVVGIAPRGFTGMSIEPVDVWLPLHVASEQESGTQWVDAPNWYMMSAIARVPAQRVTAVEEAATRVYRAGREGQRGFDADARIVLSPLIAARGPNASHESRVARLLGLLTVLVLLVTCANVGNLFLARVLSRRRELAVQAAIGVSRGRLFGQLLAEVAMLVVLAAVLALWVSALAGAALFRVLLPDAAPPEALDARVLLATLGVAFVTAALTGVLPALRATRADVMDALRQGATSVSARGARRALLMAQAAMSVVLLVGAGLFIRSLHAAESLDVGIDRSALAVTLELEGGTTFGEDLTAVVREALPRVREHGAVLSAAATSLLPFSGWWGVSLVLPAGDTMNSSGQGPFVFAVTGEYFEAVGLPIVRGRAITDADELPGAPPVMVVNERLARSVWPDADPLGRCITPVRRDGGACTTVVGVARDIVPTLTADETPMIFYLPTRDPAVGGAAANAMVIRARAGTDPDVIRRAVLEAAPLARFAAVASIGELIAPQLRPWRLGASLLTAFGLLALIIAAAGLYGTLAFDVTQRRRELGVRAALGAPATRLVRSIIAGHLATAAAGVAAGLLLALLAGRAASALLFRVRAWDPVVFAGVAITLVVAAALAALLPARAITRVDPAIPLRDD